MIQYTDSTPFGYCPYIDPKNPEKYDEDSKYYYNRHKPSNKIKKETCKSYYVNKNNKTKTKKKKLLDYCIPHTNSKTKPHFICPKESDLLNNKKWKEPDLNYQECFD